MSKSMNEKIQAPCTPGLTNIAKKSTQQKSTRHSRKDQVIILNHLTGRIVALFASYVPNTPTVSMRNDITQPPRAKLGGAAHESLANLRCKPRSPSRRSRTRSRRPHLPRTTVHSTGARCQDHSTKGSGSKRAWTCCSQLFENLAGVRTSTKFTAHCSFVFLHVFTHN